ATAHEMIAFIASNATIPKIFRPSVIYVADKRMGLTKKVVSTTAYQPLTAHNLNRRNIFWTRPASVGIAGVPRAQLIDMDECAVFFGSVNRRFGKSFRGVRLRVPGPYGHYLKNTLMLAINTTGLKHVRFSRDKGTAKLIFDDFIATLLPRLQPAGGPRTFMRDNLNAHYSDHAHNLILNAGHRLRARTP
ncbi:hypothetical protein B484DRAFT_466017, partial [Ochromonadaceae sp. CCMP2298]